MCGGDVILLFHSRAEELFNVKRDRTSLRPGPAEPDREDRRLGGSRDREAGAGRRSEALRPRPPTAADVPSPALSSACVFC